MTVNPRRAHPLSAEDAARHDAVDRGNEDATDHCKNYRLTGDLVSARSEPQQWTCLTLDDGFTCGFDGELVCRVRYRIQSDDDICH